MTPIERDIDEILNDFRQTSIIIHANDSLGRGEKGAEHIIQVKGGERIVTTNLWHQGTVPEEYRELLPDNASFVKQIEVKYIESEV